MPERGCYDNEKYNVLNLVSNDVNRFNRAITYLPSILLAPLEVSVMAAVVTLFIGWPTLLGSLVIPIFALIQIYCTRSIARLREKSTSFADKRVSLTAEVVRGIRVVKMSTWEQLYQQFILDARRFVTLQYSTNINSFVCRNKTSVVIWLEYPKFEYKYEYPK